MLQGEEGLGEGGGSGFPGECNRNTGLDNSSQLFAALNALTATRSSSEEPLRRTHDCLGVHKRPFEQR